MRLEFEDDSYAIVDSIETVKTFQLSQQQEGTDADWENLGLKNPNNPDWQEIESENFKKREPLTGSFFFFVSFVFRVQHSTHI